MKIWLTLLLGIFSNQACSETNLGPQILTSISTGWGHEGIYLSTKEQLIAEGCTGSSAVIPNDDPYFNLMNSLALSALHTGKKVWLHVSGCSANNNMVLKAIRIDV